MQSSPTPRSSAKQKLLAAAALLVAAGVGLALFLRHRSGSGQAEPAGERAFGVTAIDLRALSLESRPPSASERAELLADAGSDDWESELWSARASSVLAFVGRALAEPVPMRLGDLARHLDPGFACTELVPSALETRRSDALLRVREGRGARPSELTRRGIEGLGEALSELGASLGAGAETLVELEPFSIEPVEGGFETRVRFQAGRRHAGGAVQQDADWRVRWRPREGGPTPLLVSIALERYAEVATAVPGGALLADCTASALSHNVSYTTQILPGLDHWLTRISRLVNMSIGGHHGIAVGDVNGDGLEDLYVCDAGGLPNRLYVQREDGRLDDVSAASRTDWLEYSASALLVDLDGDGDQDLALVTRPQLVFMANDGSGRFEERLRLPAPIDPMSISAADYDLDGDLDLYVCAYNRRPDGETPAAPVPYHDAENGDANRLLRNDGELRFTDVTSAVGLDQNNARYSFVSVWEDYDDDGDLDLYVVNDFGRNNLYRNDRGRFTDVAGAAGVEDIASGMGAAFGDFDRDGRIDLYVANMFQPAGLRVAMQPRYARARAGPAAMHIARMASGNTLYRNLGTGAFEELGEDFGAKRAGWAWATRFADLDNDGWEDLLVVNGYFSMPDQSDISSFFWRQVVSRSPVGAYTKEELDDYVAAWHASIHLVARGRSFAGHERNVCFANVGGRFVDASFVSGVDWRDDGRALATLDWDGDGDLDVWVRSRTSPRLRLLRNAGGATEAGLRSVALRLQGTRSNRDGIGARVEVELEGGGARLAKTLHAGEGFLSQSSKWLHFGLGEGARVQRVRVRWPGGAREEFSGVEAGGRYLLVEQSGAARALERPERRLALEPGPQPSALEEPRSRSYLASRVPMPILRYEPLEGGATRTVATEGRPLFLTLFASGWPASIAELADLARARKRLAAAGVDALALAIDGLGPAAQNAARGQGAHETARALGTLRLPFATGRATVELCDKLALLFDLLYEASPPFGVPLGLFFDARGELALVYRGGVLADELLADARLLEVPPARREDLSTPFAGRWFGEAGGLDAPRVASWFMGRYPEDAVRYLAEWRARGAPGGGDATYSRLLLAQGLMGEGKLGEAEAIYAEAHALDPTSVEALLGRARCLVQMGRAKEALPQVQAALGLDAERAESHHLAGRIQQALESSEAAIQSYTRAVELDPDLAEARNNLGNLLKAVGRREEAMEQYLACIERRPSLPEPHYNLGEMLREAGRFEEAAAAYRAAIAVEPKLPEPHLQLGAVLVQLGRSAEALPRIAEAARLRPDWVPPLVQQSRILASASDPALRDPARAVELAEKAARLTQQGDIAVLQCLTDAYLAAGREREAIATASRAYDVAVASGNQRAAQAIQAWIQKHGG